MKFPHSPVQTLPVELLSYIFELGTHSTSSGDASDGSDSLPVTTTFNSDSVKAPLVYASISRHWRKVALGTPALWTSICITVGNVLDESSTGSLKEVLDTTHLTTYLALSRKYPIDILIDARDMDWDFYEPEIPSTLSSNPTYTPPFSSQHMKTVIDILLPHLSRWRSLDILTDTWAPMYVALMEINTPLLTYGAPKLESLTLMRCNDFISYAPQFEPSDLREPVFLSRQPDSWQSFLQRPHSREEENGQITIPRLPSLRNLILRGVHLDWDSLAELLPPPPPTPQLPTSFSLCPPNPSLPLNSSLITHAHALHTLELSSHTPDVRPTLAQFQKILATSTGSLRRLVINGSGVNFTLPESSSISYTENHEPEPESLFKNPFVSGIPASGNDYQLGGHRGSSTSSLSQRYIPSPSLPNLHTLSLGYRPPLNTFSLPNFLSLFSPPNLRTLTLEDASHPGDTEDVDGSGVLECLAGVRVTSPGRRDRGRTSPRNRAASAGVLDGTTCHHSTSSPVHVTRSSWSEGVGLNPSGSSSLVSPFLSSSPSFPILQKLTLRNVKASSEAFRTFFASVPELKVLELVGMGMGRVRDVFEGLAYSFSAPVSLSSLSLNHSRLGSKTKTPPSTIVYGVTRTCPHLQTILIRSSPIAVSDIDFMIRHLVSARCNSRTVKPLERVDIYLPGYNFSGLNHWAGITPMQSLYSVLAALRTSQTLPSDSDCSTSIPEIVHVQAENEISVTGTTTSSIATSSCSAHNTQNQLQTIPDDGDDEELDDSESDSDEILVGAWSVLAESGQTIKLNGYGSNNSKLATTAQKGTGTLLRIFTPYPYP